MVPGDHHADHLVVFSALWLGEPVRWNHAVGFGFIALGGRFVFRKVRAEEAAVKRLYDGIARLYFGLATVFLMLLALALLGWAVWEVAHAFASGEVLSVLESVGLVIIGFAIIETARFIAEEELVRRRELRSAVEARRSLTKFISIIVIAASLEALVMVFEASRTALERSIYPAVLFMAAMFALIALGAFQWLSSRIAAAPDSVEKDGEESIDHHPTPEKES